MLYNMLNSNHYDLLHVIEERLTNNERNKDTKLYQIREQRIIEIKDMTSDYLSL